MGHITPEAYLGGPLALVRAGEMERIHIPAGELTLDVDDAELDARRRAWRLPESTALPRGSLLERYRHMVGPASRGCVLE